MTASPELVQQGIRKALKSHCHTKVAVICFDKRGKLLGVVVNSQRFNRKGGGFHAEIQALRKYGQRLFSIVLLRTGKSGILRPIECCPVCAKLLEENNIKVTTTKGENCEDS